MQQVSTFLELSPHDVLALGDAENDLALFDACGFSACPGNSIAAVRERVDWVLPGGAGADVGAAITGPVLEDRLAVQLSPRPRHRITLGWGATTSEPIAIPARRINVLIHGDPHSGKSWLAGALVERLVGARYAVCVIDPEGDYRVLSRLPGVAWAEVTEAGDVDAALDHLQHNPDASAVLDLSTRPHAEKVVLIERALRRIREIRRGSGRPHWVLVDEAHYLLHDGGIARDALGVEDHRFCFVAYWPRWVREAVIQAVDVFVLARTTALEELAFLRTALPAVDGGEAVSAALPRLARGEFLIVQRDPAGRATAVTFVAAPRQTVHVRHLTKYVDSHVPPGREFRSVTPTVGCRIGQQSAGLSSSGGHRPRGAARDHAERGDFSRWVRDVFADAELARQLGKARRAGAAATCRICARRSTR